MIRKPGIVLLIVTAVTFLAAACANTDAEFTLAWTYDTDRIFIVKGEANKHVGGEQSSFNFDVNNLDIVAWQTPYCIVLVDEERLVSIFYEGEIDLEPGERSVFTASGTFPEGPVGERYGIRIVIPGEPVAFPSSIWSGRNDLHRRADWFEVSDCTPPPA